MSPTDTPSIQDSATPTPAVPHATGGRRLLRVGLLALVMLVIILQGVGFNLRWLEQSDEAERPIDAKKLLDGQNSNRLAQGIPERRPDYVIQQFDLVSSERGKKEWKVISDQAFLYEDDGITHLQAVRAWIYNSKGEATEVTSIEGKYTKNNRAIELYGNVDARLPDGFVIHSDYMIHIPDNHTVETPIPWPVTGDGRQMLQKQGAPPKTPTRETDQTLMFSSVGARANSETGRIDLLAGAVITLDRKDALKPEQSFSERRGLPDDRKDPGVPDRTVIVSDTATVLRSKKEALFKMSERTPLAQRYVRVLQPRTYARGRTAKVMYGDKAQRLNWLELDDDVLIKDRDTTETEASVQPLPSGSPVPQIKLQPTKKPVSYATAGRAEFDSESDKITLKVFPQAYQEEDTLTGDWMILHRNSDIIEVLHGNAYSTGENQKH
jgi:LPS export ABC transporter protein LptC